MPKALILFVVIFNLNLAFAESEESKVICYNRFSETLSEVNSQSQDKKCRADTIWGFMNVCFQGEAQAVVNQINNGQFQWVHGEINEAKVVTDGAITYTGTDKGNFWTINDAHMLRCPEGSEEELAKGLEENDEKSARIHLEENK